MNLSMLKRPDLQRWLHLSDDLAFAGDEEDAAEVIKDPRPSLVLWERQSQSQEPAVSLLAESSLDD